MLHSMRNVGCLNEMFNNDRSLAGRLNDLIFPLAEIEVVIFTESNIPTGLPGGSQLLVHDVGLMWQWSKGGCERFKKY